MKCERAFSSFMATRLSLCNKRAYFLQVFHTIFNFPGDLSSVVTTSDVENYFMECGEVCEVRLLSPSSPAKSPYAFIEFKTQASVDKVMPTDVRNCSLLVL